MKNWVLHTALCDGRFADEVFPLTDPLFAAYANRWEMDYVVHRVSETELSEFRGHSPAPRGTETLYANIPFWRTLLDHYEGVVFMDADAVIVDASEDICRTVSESAPFGCVECTAEAERPDVVGLNTGVVVTASTIDTCRLLDEVWNQRETFKRAQWLEQAAFMSLLGYNHSYPNCSFVAETEFTPLLTKLDWRWNAMPSREVADPFIRHPAGVQPFEKRMELLHAYAGVMV